LAISTLVGRVTAENVRIEPAEALASTVESILLVAAEPVSLADLAAATGASRGAIREALALLRRRLTGGIRLQEHAGKFQLVSAPENVDAVQRFLGAVRPAPLSRAALETLAIVAYRQPVTRAEIDSARAVDSDRALRTLLNRELVEEVGRRAGPGRPAEYGTTIQFLEYFGLTSLDQLPPLDLEPERLQASALGLRMQKGGQDHS
jgi:segregation and condensation protein B